MKTLIYTIAFDRPDSNTHRDLAKLLVRSLRRTNFDGQIVIFKNTLSPIAEPSWLNVVEVFISTDGISNQQFRGNAQSFKYQARHFLDSSLHDVIAFIDDDCIVLKDFARLLEGDWDILWQAEPKKSVVSTFHHAYLAEQEMRTLANRPGANSGTWAVKSEFFQSVMESWERIDLSKTRREKRAGDQPAWNRLLIDTRLRCKCLQEEGVRFPPFGLSPGELMGGTILHVPGWPDQKKLEFMTGIWEQLSGRDPAGNSVLDDRSN